MVFCVRRTSETVVDNPTGRQFTAGTIKKLAGLTYRQLNDWESKGALSSGRERTGWRKFSAVELVTLLVCSELRRQFGVSLESLRWISSRLLSTRAADIGRTCGPDALDLWLVTNLQDKLAIEPSGAIPRLLQTGFVARQRASGCILLNLDFVRTKLVSAKQRSGSKERR